MKRASLRLALLLVGLAQPIDGVRAAGTRVDKHPPVAIISEDEMHQVLERHRKRGRPVVLHLWATWCQPCLQELPLMGELARQSKQRGYELYSVSLDSPTDRAARKVAEVLAERGGQGMSRAIVRIADLDLFVSRIDPGWDSSIPAFFGYDARGKLRDAIVGEVDRAGFDRFVAGLTTAPVKK